MAPSTAMIHLEARAERSTSQIYRTLLPCRWSLEKHCHALMLQGIYALQRTYNLSSLHLSSIFIFPESLNGGGNIFHILLRILRIIQHLLEFLEFYA